MKLPLLLFYAAGTLAAPFMVLDDNLPKAQVDGLLGNCQSSRFNQGQTYAYDYAGETISNIEGASVHSTGMQLRTRVLITPLSECKFSMSLSNTELLIKSKNQETFSRSQDSSKLQRDLENHELLFTMSGNKITTLVAHTMEQTNILNMKRGILSTLQFEKDTTQETDVNGVCESVVAMENENTFVETKKLSDCSQRAQNEYGIQAASFKTESTVKPLESTSRCTYTMDEDMIKSVDCEEQHIFKPFSAGYETPSGAMTLVRQSMKFVTFKDVEATDLVASDYPSRTTLVFDHTKEELKSTNVLANTADSIMTSLVSKNTLSAQQSSAHEFTALVMVLRKMNEKALKPVWDKYFDCIKSKACNSEDLQGVYRQYLLDAIAYCGTSTCVSFVRDVIIDGEIQGERVNMFLQSIALVGETAKDMIRDVLDIAKKQPSRQAYLTLGTLMYRHCKKTPTDCESSSVNPISKAESFLEEILGSSCEGQEDHKRVEEILMALKAIGNAKRPSRLRGTLLKCAETAQHANITHSAFHAFKSMPCGDQIFTDKLLRFIKNENIDPEKRIHAFRAAMQCPTEYVLERLVDALEKEPSKQVSSYMWTHLSNIMESSNPEHENAKNLLTKLTNNNPLKPVDLPVHQYSKFYEKSIGINNIGGSAEGHVIFHPDGYLPRTGMLNLKGNFLGNSIDIFETMVHLEGAEDCLDDWIGTNGLLNKDFLIEIFNSSFSSEKLREMFQKHEEKTRPKRAAKMGGKLNQIHKKVDMKPSKPAAHINIKIMGQEVRVFSYDDLYWLIDEIDNMNVIQLLTDVAKGGHKTFTKSLMFLEMSHVVPIGVGLPLKLKLTGSTVASMELDGKFDIRNMFWGPGSIHIKGYIKPSAVVEVSGQMGIDSVYTTSGIFVNSSMFMSNIMKGNIIFQNGKLLKINLDTPEEAVQLFNVSSTPYMYLNEQADLIEGTERKINPDKCFKSKIIGYGLCTSLRIPFAFREYEAPYFPLSGPAHFGVKLIRGDEKLTTYQFLVKMEKKGKETIGKMEFSTPGAYYERKLGGTMKYKDVWGQKTLIFSTEKNGKSGQIQFSYNPNTKRHFIESKTNFFTPKEVVSRMEVFNTFNMVSEQYGLSYSLIYDWYKFEHVTKYVKKDSGYMLHSSTTYAPKKSVTGVIEYITKERKLVARVDVNQLKQAFELSGQMKKTVSETGIIITGTHLTSQKSASIYMGYVNEENKKEFITRVEVVGKKASSVMGYYNRNGLKSFEHVVIINGKTGKFVAALKNSKTIKKAEMSFILSGKKMAESTAVLTNTDIERSLLLSATAAGKTVQSKIGYYVKSRQQTVKAEFDLDGRKAEMFFNLFDAEEYRYTFGGLAGQYSAGVRGVYQTENGKKVCMSMYYGLNGEEKQPLTTCISYKSLSNDYSHKRLSLTVESSKSLTFNIDLKKQGKESSVSSTFIYNGEELLNEIFTVVFDTLSNAEIKYKLTIGKYYGGYNLFTRSKGVNGKIGIEGFYMEKTVMLINTWVINNLEKATDRSFKTELVVNGKTLPVSTTLNLFTEKGVFGPSARLTVGKVSVAYATMVNYASGDYSLMDEVVILQDKNSLFKAYRKTSLTLKAVQKELVQKFGVVVFGKTYEYGWESALVNQGTKSKTTFDVIFRLQYSTTRKSVATFTFADNTKSSSLLINFEYIPTKSVSHSIIFNKKINEITVDIEFLPKMHTKFMARLDTKNGYKFTTDFGLQWKKYKRSMQTVNTFKNTKKIFEISTKLGDIVRLSMTVGKTNPKKLILNGRVLKTNIKFVTTLMKKIIRFNIVKNGKALANVGLGFSRVGHKWTFSILKGRKTVFKLSGDYNKFINEVYMTAKLGKKELVGLSGRFDKSRGMLVGSISYSRKIYFKAIGKKTQKMVSIKFVAPTMQRDITFAAEVKKGTKTVIISAKSGNVKVGVEARADWNNKVASFNGFYNKHVAGVSLTATKKAITYKMTFTPKVSMQVVFEIINDRILKMTISRQAGTKMITETSMHYKLSRKMSQFVVEWNTKYFRKMSQYVTPKINNLMKDMKKYFNKARVQSTKYVQKTADKMATVAMDFVDNVDNSFDNIDFVGVRDKVGSTAVNGLRKMSALVEKAFKQLIKALNTIKKEMPQLRRRLNKITVQTIQYLRALPKDLKANMKVLNANLKEIQTIITKVAKNLTESSRPVVKKAIELVKKFKLRGKTIEEISSLAQEKAEELVKVYTEQAKAKFEILKTKSEEFYGKSKEYVLKMKIPYRKETVADVIEIILVKITELQLRIKEIDAKKMMDETKEYVLNYKIYGLTPEKHFNNLRIQMKNLPAETKQMILKLIKLVRKYSKDVEVMYAKVAKFAEPMANHLSFVKASAIKRFGPLYKDAATFLEAEIEKISLPSMKPLVNFITSNGKVVEEFVMPLVTPLKPMYQNIMGQIRKLSVMGVRVGPMFDMNVEMLSNSIDQYVSQSKKMMDEQMTMMRNFVTKYSEMTPEQTVEKVFESSADMSEQVISYVTTMYEQRQQWYNECQQKLESIYAELKSQYTTLKQQANDLTARKPEDILKDFYKNAEKRILEVVDELTNIANQLAALEVSKPTMEAWKQADLLGHLGRYGINQKTSEMIKAMKDVRLTKVILKTIEIIKKFYNDFYSQAFVRAVRTYTKLEKAVEYVRSIPKKEYEEWYQELRSFAMDNKDKFVNFVTSNYKISKKSAIKYYQTFVSLSNKNYNKLKDLYNNRAKPIFNRISKQSQLFYDDVKQPTIDVAQHYKTIAETFMDKHYTKYEKIVREYYSQLKTKAENKLEDLRAEIEKQYQNFLSKYGDMTWEQVGDEIVKFGEEKYGLAKNEYNKNYKKAEKIVAEYKQKAEKLYKQAKAQYEKYMAKMENEIKPKVMARYEEIKVKVETMVEKYSNEASKLMKELRSKGMKIYIANKDKTFKRIYREIKAIIVKEFNVQYAKATKLYNEKSKEATKMAKIYYNKLNTLVFDTILPEANLEMQSIINQTLKNSVVMAETVVKAYTPHYNLVKRETIKYSKILVNKITVVLEKSQVELEKSMAKLEKLVKDLIEKLKEHEYTKKAIVYYKQALKHKYVVEAREKLEKLIKMTQDKIEEIKSHPTTKKYTKLAQKKLTQLKKQMKVYEKKLNKLMKDPTYKRMVKIMAKVQKSAKFTYNKLVKKVTPYVRRVRKTVEKQMENVPVKAQKAFTFFRQEPEEAFWVSVKMVKDLLKDTYETLSSIDISIIKDNRAVYFKNAKDFMINTIEEITDDWTKASTKKMYREAVKMTKQAEKKLKALPGKLRRMATKEYKEKMQILKKWYKQTRIMLIKQWNKCPYKAIYDNQIWSEIAEEVTRHELTKAAFDVGSFTAEKAQELRSLAIKEYKKQKAAFEKKIKELKTMANNKFEELKLKVEELKVKGKETYEKMIAEYKKMVAEVDKFLETTTIANVVEYTQKKFKEFKTKATKAKVELERTAKKNMEKAWEHLKKYQLKARDIYENAIKELRALYKKHIEPKVNKYKARAEMYYAEYYPKMEAKYLELKEKALEKYELYMSEGKKMFYAYKVKGIELYKKTRKQAHSKWMESEVRAKLMTLKGMTIKETIEALKKLPKETKLYVKAMYAKYSAKAKAEFNQRYAKLVKEFELRRDQIVQLAKPYTVPALEAYKWVENEIAETAIFVYKYHRISERSVQLRDFVTSEIERLTPIVKANLKKLAKDMKKMAQKYKIEGQKLAYEYASTVGDKTLRGIHSGMKYIDSIDMKKYQDEARSYFTELNKYISFEEGKITITIPHGEVTPSISHHIKKVGRRAQRSINNAKQEGQKLMKKIKAELKKLQTKADKLRKQITQTVLENTVEVRRDLKQSFNVNSKVVRRVYDNAKIFGQKTYKKAMLKYKTLKAKSNVFMKKAKALYQKYYKKMVQVSQKIYLKSSEIFMDIYSAGIFNMHERAYFHANKYTNMAKIQFNKMIKQHKPTVLKIYKKYTTMIKFEAKKMRNQITPYYLALNKAYNDVRSGVPVKKALKPVLRQAIFASRDYQRQAIKKLSKAKSMFCRRDPKLCKHLKESSRIHQKLFEKYYARFLDLVATGKAQLDRTIRKISKYTTRPFFGDYNVAATMFGDHVLTFDNKYFQMVENKRQDCSYLLAHDFSENQFTVKTLGDGIVIETPDMSVSIKKNGNIKAFIGNEVSKTLPVESKSGNCVRKESFVICHFMAKNFKIVVDLENEITTLSVSGWYYGKTQGIFGTYNRESYDDWKLPNGEVTNNIYKFLNSYEISGKQKCQLKNTNVKTKSCNRFPSRRCEQLFSKASSPFVTFFDAVNPEPFWQACIADTTSCTKKVKGDSHCKSVAAFAAVARAMGQWVEYPSECSSYKSYEVGQKFNQKPLKKALDVVVLVSQQETQQKHMDKTFYKFMNLLHGMLKNKKKMNVRYAVVGFGGAGVSEEAHVKAIGRDTFGNLGQATSVIKNMKYDGKSDSTNDAFMAISEAANLPFRAGASKVFILFNANPHTAHKLGATLDEAKYALGKEIEGTLIAFSDVTFKRGRKVIGQSTRRIYTLNKNIPGNFELPASEYKDLVENTEGGLFSKDIRDSLKTAKAAYEIISQKIKQNNEHCKICRVVVSWSGQANAVCESKKGLKC